MRRLATLSILTLLASSAAAGGANEGTPVRPALGIAPAFVAVAPADAQYGPGPGVALTVLRRPDSRIALGARAGYRRLLAETTFAERGGQVLPPYSVGIEAIPMEALLRLRQPFGRRIALWGQVGAGAELARSRFESVQKSASEEDLSATASASIGAVRGRLVVEAGYRLSRHAFSLHNRDRLDGFEVTAGWEF